MVIVESLRKRTCKLPNVKDKLNFKQNDIPTKHINDFLIDCGYL